MTLLAGTCPLISLSPPRARPLSRFAAPIALPTTSRANMAQGTAKHDLRRVGAVAQAMSIAVLPCGCVFERDPCRPTGSNR
jgi:hypothetical protein